MIAAVAGWLQAATDTLTSTLGSAAVVHLGPMVTFDDIAGADLVIVGHDDDDDTGLAAEYTGQWHDTGATAVHRGQALAYITVVSQSGGTALTMAQRLAALDTLVAQVRAALLPTPTGSALAADGVMWAQEAGTRLHMVPTSAGPIARAVLTFTLDTLA